MKSCHRKSGILDFETDCDEVVDAVAVVDPIDRRSRAEMEAEQRDLAEGVEVDHENLAEGVEVNHENLAEGVEVDHRGRVEGAEAD